MFVRVLVAVAMAAGLLACAGIAHAQSDAPPLEVYGGSPAIEHIQLSPDGEMLARVRVADERREIVINRLADGARLFSSDAGTIKVRDLRWVGNGRILVVTSQTRDVPALAIPRSELFFGQLIDLSTGRITQVFDRTPDVLAVLYGPASVRATTQGEALFVRGVNIRTENIDLHRIDLRTGRGRTVAYMDHTTEDHVLDGDGKVIAISRYDDRTGRWALRLPDGQNYRDAWTVEAPLDSPTLHGQGRSPRTIIVNADRPDLSSAESDYIQTWFEVDIDNGAWTRLPFEHHPDFLIHHPATGLLIGAGRVEATGVRYEFLDPDASARWQLVERAFAERNPELVSWSDALGRIVVFTETAEAGQFHLVDFARGAADIIADAYPAISPDHVGEVRPVQYLAQDGQRIHGYLTLPPGASDPDSLPLVVLAHGGPAARDVAGFDWWAQAMASRGYAVLQANFRGSTGYGRAFLEAGYGEWGGRMQTDLSDGVRWLAAEGIIDASRVCIVGASYGGYAAMAGLTLDQGVYRCGVSVAGVSDLRRMVNRESRQERHRDSQTVRYWNRSMGAARLNDRALDDRSPAHLAARIDGPLLLIHGRDDTVVPIEQSRIMADALRRAGKPVELIEMAGEDHWLSQSATRRRMLSETMRFLEAHNPAR